MDPFGNFGDSRIFDEPSAGNFSDSRIFAGNHSLGVKYNEDKSYGQEKKTPFSPNIFGNSTFNQPQLNSNHLEARIGYLESSLEMKSKECEELRSRIQFLESQLKIRM